MQKGPAKKLLLDRKELVNVVNLPKKSITVFGIKESFRNNLSGFIFLLCALSIPLIAGGKKNSERRVSRRNLGTFG